MFQNENDLYSITQHKMPHLLIRDSIPNVGYEKVQLSSKPSNKVMKCVCFFSY